MPRSRPSPLRPAPLPRSDDTVTLPSVLVLVLNWNLADVTIQCLDSCMATSYPHASFLLVDNGSSDRIRDEIREWANSRPQGWREVMGSASRPPSDQELTILFHQSNSGYAAGNNLGLSCALAWGVDWVLVLNNDATIPPDYIPGMVAAGMALPDVGLIGSRQKYPSEYGLRPSCGVRISYNLGAYPFHRYPCRGGTRIANFAPGNSVLIRVEMLRKVGLFDERYFLYSEDVDLSYRAMSARWRIAINCDVTAEQHVSKSLGRRSPTYYYYLVRNTLLFLSERLHGWRRYVSMSTFTTMIAIRTAIWILTGMPAHAEAARLGSEHFRQRRFGPAPSIDAG